MFSCGVYAGLTHIHRLLPRGLGVPQARLAARVTDNCIAQAQESTTLMFEPKAYVVVLVVQEDLLVESSDRFKGGAAHKECGT